MREPLVVNARRTCVLLLSRRNDESLAVAEVVVQRCDGDFTVARDVVDTQPGFAPDFDRSNRRVDDAIHRRLRQG